MEVIDQLIAPAAATQACGSHGHTVGEPFLLILLLSLRLLQLVDITGYSGRESVVYWYSI